MHLCVFIELSARIDIVTEDIVIEESDLSLISVIEGHPHDVLIVRVDFH